MLTRMTDPDAGRPRGDADTWESRELIAARARVDQQTAHLDRTAAQLISVARGLTVETVEDLTGATALLAERLMRDVGDQPEFLAELLARILLTRIPRSDPLTAIYRPQG